MGLQSSFCTDSVKPRVMVIATSINVGSHYFGSAWFEPEPSVQEEGSQPVALMLFFVNIKKKAYDGGTCGGRGVKLLTTYMNIIKPPFLVCWGFTS